MAKPTKITMKTQKKIPHYKQLDIRYRFGGSDDEDENSYFDEDDGGNIEEIEEERRERQTKKSTSKTKTKSNRFDYLKPRPQSYGKEQPQTSKKHRPPRIPSVSPPPKSSPESVAAPVTNSTHTTNTANTPKADAATKSGTTTKSSRGTLAKRRCYGESALERKERRRRMKEERAASKSKSKPKPVKSSRSKSSKLKQTKGGMDDMENDAGEDDKMEEDSRFDDDGDAADFDASDAESAGDAGDTSEKEFECAFNNDDASEDASDCGDGCQGIFDDEAEFIEDSTKFNEVIGNNVDNKRKTVLKRGTEGCRKHDDPNHDIDPNSRRGRNGKASSKTTKSSKVSESLKNMRKNLYDSESNQSDSDESSGLNFSYFRKNDAVPEKEDDDDESTILGEEEEGDGSSESDDDAEDDFGKEQKMKKSKKEEHSNVDEVGDELVDTDGSTTSKPVHRRLFRDSHTKSRKKRVVSEKEEEDGEDVSMQASDDESKESECDRDEFEASNAKCAKSRKRSKLQSKEGSQKKAKSRHPNEDIGSKRDRESSSDGATKKTKSSSSKKYGVSSSTNKKKVDAEDESVKDCRAEKMKSITRRKTSSLASRRKSPEQRLLASARPTATPQEPSSKPLPLTRATTIEKKQAKLIARASVATNSYSAKMYAKAAAATAKQIKASSCCDASTVNEDLYDDKSAKGKRRAIRSSKLSSKGGKDEDLGSCNSRVWKTPRSRKKKSAVTVSKPKQQPKPFSQFEFEEMPVEEKENLVPNDNQDANPSCDKDSEGDESNRLDVDFEAGLDDDNEEENDLDGDDEDENGHDGKDENTDDDDNASEYQPTQDECKLKTAMTSTRPKRNIRSSSVKKNGERDSREKKRHKESSALVETVDSDKKSNTGKRKSSSNRNATTTDSDTRGGGGQKATRSLKKRKDCQQEKEILHEESELVEKQPRQSRQSVQSTKHRINHMEQSNNRKREDRQDDDDLSRHDVECSLTSSAKPESRSKKKVCEVKESKKEIQKQTKRKKDRALEGPDKNEEIDRSACVLGKDVAESDEDKSKHSTGQNKGKSQDEKKAPRSLQRSSKHDDKREEAGVARAKKSDSQMDSSKQKELMPVDGDHSFDVSSKSQAGPPDKSNILTSAKRSKKNQCCNLPLDPEYTTKNNDEEDCDDPGVKKVSKSQNIWRRSDDEVENIAAADDDCLEHCLLEEGLFSLDEESQNWKKKGTENVCEREVFTQYSAQENEESDDENEQPPEIDKRREVFTQFSSSSSKEEFETTSPPKEDGDNDRKLDNAVASTGAAQTQSSVTSKNEENPVVNVFDKNKKSSNRVSDSNNDPVHEMAEKSLNNDAVSFVQFSTRNISKLDPQELLAALYPNPNHSESSTHTPSSGNSRPSKILSAVSFSDEKPKYEDTGVAKCYFCNGGQNCNVILKGSQRSNSLNTMKGTYLEPLIPVLQEMQDKVNGVMHEYIEKISTALLQTKPVSLVQGETHG